MGSPGTRRGLTLDAGGLIALERGQSRVVALVRTALDREREITIPAVALAQAWRDGSRQARLATVVRAATVDPLDAHSARAAGALCARSGTADVVDASVVVSARTRDDHVVTSDPADLYRLDAGLRVIAI